METVFLALAVVLIAAGWTFYCVDSCRTESLKCEAQYLSWKAMRDIELGTDVEKQRELASRYLKAAEELRARNRLVIEDLEQRAQKLLNKVKAAS